MIRKTSSRFYWLSIFFFGCNLLCSQVPNPLLANDTEAQQKWVDSVYNALSLEEKIGQLYMVDVNSQKDSAELNRALNLVRNHKVGGVIFMRGFPTVQAKWTNILQSNARIPLLIGIDGEWGLAMRLDSTYAYPWNMTLGAVKNMKLIEDVGRQIAKHHKRLGIHINFAPAVDINTNPLNPIIGNRSFGEDRDGVTQRALAFMKGLQQEGILASAKHFPGHGDTSEDSHRTLPTVWFLRQRLDSVELYPYKKLINENLASIMVGHLNVPALEPSQSLPSSFSEKVVKGLLQQELGFNGLIFTDALNMRGASNFGSSPDVDLAAFLAGNDMLLISANPVAGIAALKEAYQQKKISEERLATSVKKVLMAKYLVGLKQYKPVLETNVVTDLNTLQDQLLHEQIMEEALTVVKNSKSLLPFKNLENRKIAYVKFGDGVHAPFLKMLKRYTSVDEVSADDLSTLIELLKPFNTVIIGHHRKNDSPWDAYRLTEKELVWLYEIAREREVVLTTFVKPYSLKHIKTFENIEAVVVGYQNSDIAQEKMAQLLFGAIPGKGELPVTVGNFAKGTAINTADFFRLSYGLPESVGLSSEKLKKIDSTANVIISNGTVPGAQILVARKGKVVYNKSFGRPFYGADEFINEEHIYDLASLTKILATLPMIMELEQNGTLTLETTLGELLPKLKKSNKANISLLEALSHYGRFKAWIPFYTATLDQSTKRPSEKYYRTEKEGRYSLKVADELYIRRGIKDTIFNQIKDSPLLPRKRYLYSDLPYYLLKDYLEQHYDEPLDELVQSHFYKSLGANFTTYNPLEKFNKGQIVPTEVDDYYRYQTVQGYVHDMGAAMLGGVGGHAGLFANANDVAKIMQMYLQKGYYGGKRFLNHETVEKFNKCFFCEERNRRGVGFDKPQLGEEGPTCGCASMSSFGHSGFTGTFTWADPESEIVYVFLSNRTYPTQKNQRLISDEIRSKIQQFIYDAIVE